jgi:hypothetical protein
MKTKFEKFFDELQAKGKSFQNIAFKDLTEDQSHELHNLYLDKADERVKSLEAKHAEAIVAQESINKEAYDREVAAKAKIKAELDEIKTDVAQKNQELTKLTYEMTKKVAQTMLESAKGQGSIRDANTRAAIEECKVLHKSLSEAVKNGDKATFTIKADTLTTSVANFTRGVEDPVVVGLATRRLTAYESIPRKITIPANAGGTYRYLEQNSATSVRAAANIAEGTPSPESTIIWAKQSLDLIKTSDHLPYSEEFEYDFQNLMKELVSFLRQNIDIIVDDQIITGTGAALNYDGIIFNAPAFTPVASGITDANIYDLIVKVSEDITDGEGSKYQPNIVYMNSADIDSIDFELKKDANNNYMSLRERALKRGIAIVENNAVVANTLFLGDNRYASIIQDGMLTIKTGLTSGTDAIDGIQRVLVSTRKNLLIKNEETTAWREVTSISAALTTLAT